MWIVAILVAVGATLFVSVWNASTRRGSRPVFLQRPEMSVQEMHREFYAGSPISEQGLRDALQDISGHLGVPVTKLRPMDRFDLELAPTRGWAFDDEIADLEWIAQESLRKRGFDPAAISSIRTVDDYVRTVCGE